MKRLSFIKRSAVTLACLLGLAIGTPPVHAFDDDDLFGGGGSSAGGGDISNVNIDELFGVFGDEPDPEPTEAPKRVLPPFTGTYKVLVVRPIYAVYEAERNTQWISALGELYAHYKVASFPRTQVFTKEQVAAVLPNFRDYSRRFSRQHYIDAARRLGATHILFQEYQPQRGGRRTQYLMDLWRLDENASEVRAVVAIDHANFEAGLNAAMAQIAAGMDQGASGTAAFRASFLGGDLKILEPFGNALAAEGNFSAANAAAAYAASERTIQRNGQLLVVQYAAALLSGRAGEYARAITQLEQVISRSGDYPALQLRLAEYLRGAGRHADAMRAAETAARVPALKIPAAMEIAAIHQAQGNLDRARSEYEAIIAAGAGDASVFFRLALLSIQMGRMDESEGFMRRAEQSGLTLAQSELFAIGEAYASLSGHEDRALDFLRRSMGVQQNSEPAWAAIAEIQKRMGNKQQQAEAYVNLFMINQRNHPRLKMAGEIYEQLGMTERAKDAYSLFIDRRFEDLEVTMSLARIYFNERECRRIEPLLRGLSHIPEAVEMMEGCNIRVRRVDASQTVQKKKLSPLMLTLRITGGVLFAGGLGGGLFLNSMVANEVDDYNAWNRAFNPHDERGLPERSQGGRTENPDEVKKMRENIESWSGIRNIMYIMSGVGLGTFAVTFFF